MRPPIRPHRYTDHAARCANHPGAERAHGRVVWQPFPGDRRAVMTATRDAVDEQFAAAVRADMPHRYRREGLLLSRLDHRSHSSSASRFTAGASGFLLLIQSGERPDLYRESFRFETM